MPFQYPPWPLEAKPVRIAAGIISLKKGRITVKRVFMALAAVSLLVLLAACSQQGQQNQSGQQQGQAEQPQQAQPGQQQTAQGAPPAQGQPGQTQQAPAGTAQPRTAAGHSQQSAGTHGAAPAGSAMAPAASTTPAAPQFASVPQGTRFEIRLSDAISSGANKAGDTFNATLDKDLVADGRTVAARGSAVTGKIVSAEGSGRVKGRARMSLRLIEIRAQEASYPIQTNSLSFEAQGSEKSDALKIGGGAGLGAIIGAIAGGGKGAAIGAAVGGGAGTATVLATKGKEVKFQPEEKFSFVLKEDLKVRLR